MWLGALGVCALLVALRWNSLDAPLVRDEGEYAYSAQLLKAGRFPYEHAFLPKPPIWATQARWCSGKHAANAADECKTI